jgi:hypothetical protein
MPSTVKLALNEVQICYKALVAATASEVGDLPKTQGVYLIRNKEGRIIYAGKAKNLRRRICHDHRGAGEKKSIFRRKVSRAYGIPAGMSVRDWVRDNCSFAFKEVPEPDLCAALEAVTILLLRRAGCSLLNS